MATDEEAIVYQIDSHDRIICVNDAWDRFAVANDGDNLLAKDVTHRSLWDYITGLTTRRIYSDVLRSVRNGRIITFALRCDSLSTERRLEMRVVPKPDGVVEFQTHCLATAPRPAAILPPQDMSNEAIFLRQCGWCARFSLDGQWLDAADALPRLDVFETLPPPQLTHGICPDCMAQMRAEIGALR